MQQPLVVRVYEELAVSVRVLYNAVANLQSLRFFNQCEMRLIKHIALVDIPDFVYRAKTIALVFHVI